MFNLIFSSSMHLKDCSFMNIYLVSGPVSYVQLPTSKRSVVFLPMISLHIDGDFIFRRKSLEICIDIW